MRHTPTVLPRRIMAKGIIRRVTNIPSKRWNTRPTLFGTRRKPTRSPKRLSLKPRRTLSRVQRRAVGNHACASRKSHLTRIGFGCPVPGSAGAGLFFETRGWPPFLRVPLDHPATVRNHSSHSAAAWFYVLGAALFAFLGCGFSSEISPLASTFPQAFFTRAVKYIEHARNWCATDMHTESRRSPRWRILARGHSSHSQYCWNRERSKIRGGTSLETHRFAAAQSNSFRMTLLYKSQNNFRRDRRPGRIVSGETLLESAHSAENRFQKPAKNKSLRITSLYKRKNNCPGITLLQKKVGGGGLWAHFLGHSLN